MKILVLNWRDPWHPLAGGAEIMMYEHVKYWQKKGAEITWFTSCYENAATSETKVNIHFIRRGSEHTVHLYFFWEYIKHNLSDFHVIIDCFHFVPFFTPLYIKNKKIIAVIHEIAGKIWFKNINIIASLIGYFLEPLFFIFYRNIQFLTVSESTKSELIKLKIPADAICICQNGISVPTALKKIDKTTFPSCMFLGRISKDKGIEDVIQAFHLINKELPTAQLWVVGKEQEKGLLQKMIKHYCSTCLENIRFFNFVDEDTKYALLQQSWLLLHASDKEGWGLTIIEAASQGTPSIAYDVPGLRDSVKNNKTGILLKKNTASEMAQETIRMISNGNLYKTYRKACIEYAKNFTWEYATKQSWKIVNSTATS